MAGAAIGAPGGPIGIIAGAVVGGLIGGLSIYFGFKKAGETYLWDSDEKIITELLMLCNNHSEALALEVAECKDI